MEASKTHQNSQLVALFVIFMTLLGPQGLSAQESKPVLGKTARSSEYNRPIYFDFLNPENLPTPFIEYELSEKGNQLKIGPVTVDEKTFSFGLRRLSELDPSLASTNDPEHFYARWPRALFREARIELLNRDGQVIWKYDVTENAMKNWRSETRKLAPNPKSPLRLTNWGIDFSKSNLPFQGLADGFRFCLTRLTAEISHERLCSQSYVMRQSGQRNLLGRLREVRPFRVLVNGESADSKGEVKAEGDLPARFFVEMSTGETYEFSSKPTKVKWADYVKLEGTDLFRAIGTDIPPAGPYKIINPEKYSKWVEAVGFQPTIYDNRKFWMAQFKSDKPCMYFEGETGGIFKHPLPTEKVPSSKIRLYLHKRTPLGTYRDGVWVNGSKQSTSLISSQEYETRTKSDSRIFDWSFKASNPAQINRSYLMINDGGENYRAYYELYKGYSNELSGRMSTILSTSGIILMGEAAYSHWFEDVLGWDQYYLTKQRWGVSAKYFQSFTKYQVKGVGSASLKVTNVDLKYRFSPGLWTRDESHGAMISYQDMDVDLGITKFKVPMVGAGWFWARSMPRFFDDIFNVVPWMRYPKWVDMEFIYYTGSTDSTKKLNFNFALNFHGQVLWKENFFGEAGFGIKRYAVIDGTNPYQANLGYALNTLYGTLGIGIKF